VYKDSSGNYTKKGKIESVYYGDHAYSGNNVVYNGLDLGGTGTRIKIQVFEGTFDSSGMCYMSMSIPLDKVRGVIGMGNHTSGQWSGQGFTDSLWLSASVSTGAVVLNGDASRDGEPGRAIVFYED
jgi:hypothetical protein